MKNTKSHPLKKGEHTTRKEAWNWVDKAWFLHGPKVEDKTLCRVQESLRRLRQLSLPISAIDEITTLLKVHEEYILLAESISAIDEITTLLKVHEEYLLLAESN